jgi:hypothetical protein
VEKTARSGKRFSPLNNKSKGETDNSSTGPIPWETGRTAVEKSLSLHPAELIIRHKSGYKRRGKRVQEAACP